MLPTSSTPTDLSPLPTALHFDLSWQRSVGGKFWLAWTLATATGWIGGACVYSGLIQVLGQASFVIWVMLIGALYAGVMAIAFGGLQGLVIRRLGFSSRKWMSSSMVGGIIGGLLSTAAAFLFALVINPLGRSFHILYSPTFTFATDVLFLTMCGLITGAAIGYRQRRVLRDSPLEKLPWTTINAFSWAIGCAAIVPASWLLCRGTLYPFFGIVGNYVVQSVVLIAACGLIGGTFTGYPLMRALQHSSIQNPKSEI